MDRWQSMTMADIWINLTVIPSGPVVLFVSKDLIILLISLAVGFGISNLLSVLKTLFIFWMLGRLLYTDMIVLTVSLSLAAFKQSRSDKGFFPEDFWTMFI